MSACCRETSGLPLRQTVLSFVRPMVAVFPMVSSNGSPARGVTRSLAGIRGSSIRQLDVCHKVVLINGVAPKSGDIVRALPMAEKLIFDHYEVLTRADGSLFELGRGAMGITYKAFDTNLRVNVALKVINAKYLESEVAQQRFMREARAAAQLRHPNVASVFHLGTSRDAFFYAMEFVDGETVESFIKRNGPIDPVVALRITLQVTRALAAAAKHHLVHRDIKPANLMLVREDDDFLVKVIDFGLAKSIKHGENDDLATVSMGGFVGTAHFASPEQLEEKEIDVRSDIYSLGVTLWYMLAGQVPFGGSLAQVMSQHLHKSPPLEKLQNLPECVRTVVGYMIEKDPAKRPQTPAALRAELENCLAVIEAGSAADQQNL